jgi:SulP family sulfate permease
MAMGLDIRSVGDMGALPDSLPMFLLPNIPLNLETLMIILPYSVTLAAVGLPESLMTAVIVVDITDTPNQKNRECAGQGAANIVAGCFGGMAGCAMIGQSVINVKSGGRGRLSSLVAGTMLLFLILVLGDYVRQIPMAALVAVMIMVSISTFSWQSLANLRRHPPMSSFVMLTVVAIVVATHNLALGVFVGVLISALSFASKVARFCDVTSDISPDGTHRSYTVLGHVFFTSAPNFIAQFDLASPPPRVTIDMTHAHFWDITGGTALDKVVLKLRRAGAEVQVLGMNATSATLVDTLGTHHKPQKIDALFDH